MGGTSMMSVIIEAGALSMLSNFNHRSLTSTDIPSTISPNYESSLHHVFAYMPIRHDARTEHNAEIDRNNFLEESNKQLNDLMGSFSMELFSSFLKTSSNLNKNTQDQERPKNFMASLASIEKLWKKLGISLEYICSDNPNDTNSLKREVVEATYNYMNDFSLDNPDFLKNDAFQNKYMSHRNETNLIRPYWGAAIQRENKENQE